MNFQLGLIVFGAVLLGLAAFAGIACGKGVLGILIDTRGRYSLNHLQVVMWTLLVLATFLALFAIDLEVDEIPYNLLVLMGISAGSAATAGAVKGGKDSNPAALIARVAPQQNVAGIQMARVLQLPAATLSQLFLEEEGEQALTTVSVTKFQNLIFTAVLGIAYVVLALDTGGFPELTESMLWLIGISHASYVGGKIPNKV